VTITEVREVQDAAYSESVLQALERGIDLHERYGQDAERAFWDRVAASYVEVE
jgi:hypothetical protein